MKRYKFFLAALLLCGSQVVLAAEKHEDKKVSKVTLSFEEIKQIQQAALESALAAVSNAVINNTLTQTLVYDALQAAANAGVSAPDIGRQLYKLGVPTNLVTVALTANISLGINGVQVACAPKCDVEHPHDVSYTNTSLTILTAALTVAASSSATAQATNTSGGTGSLPAPTFTTPGTSGGPSGPVSPN